MPDLTQLALYVAAALVLAVTPGPGLFYVAARTLAGGRAEGVASSFGTGLRGMVHVLAGSFGVSAVVLASAELFTALKLIGAAYLIWLGFRTVQSARRQPAGLNGAPAAAGVSRRHAGRGAESEDGSLLPRLHPAVRRPGPGRRRAAIRRARLRVGCAQHACRHRRRLRGRRHPGWRRRTPIAHSPPSQGVGSRDDRARDRPDAGEAPCRKLKAALAIRGALRRWALTACARPAPATGPWRQGRRGSRPSARRARRRARGDSPSRRCRSNACRRTRA